MCGEPMSHDTKIPFCDDCIKIWEEYLDEKCNMCGLDRFECHCVPKMIRKINSVAIWSIFYCSNHEEPNSLIYSIKTGERKKTIDYFTDLMKRTLIAKCMANKIRYKDYVITFAPRQYKGIRKFGHDHAEMLAKSLGKKLGIKVVRMLENNSKVQQKKLNKSERVENAFNAYEYIEGSLEGKRKVFIVDDIMTTGATLCACAFLLYENGAKDVIPVTLAKDNFGYMIK